MERGREKVVIAMGICILNGARAFDLDEAAHVNRVRDFYPSLFKSMTQVAVLRSEVSDAAEAGALLGRSILDELAGEQPDAVILFASPSYAARPLLQGIHEGCSPGALVGCSSAGEFTFDGTSSASAVALAIRSDDLRFKVHVMQDLKADLPRAAQDFAASFDPREDPRFPHRTVLLLMDVLAGYGEAFLELFTEATSGRYEVFGGGAADDAAFKETFVFAGRDVFSDAAAGLEIQSKKPVGIGVSHGWAPLSHSMKVTSASGLRLYELDGRPAVDVIAEFAKDINIEFDREEPLPFFLNHVLGIESNDGYKLRVPLQVGDDGSLVCAAEVPVDTDVRVMHTRDTSAAEAARTAARKAWLKLKNVNAQPGAVLFFDCAATRLRLGDRFGASVDEVVDILGTESLVGCNTYGQFARVEGQYGGFHNCTAVVFAFAA